MSYAALYASCQSVPPHISRGFLYDHVLTLTGVPRIRHFRTTLDVSSCRGFYLSARNTQHPFVQQAGARVIVTARGLNRCWERFVYVKELMHSFDDPSESTDTGERFEELLGEIMGPISPENVQGLAEVNCFWMALGVLCPEPVRQAFHADREAGRIDDYSIALKLLIPQGYVPRLFEPRYSDNLAHLIK
jgi:hypothetical protein